MTDRQSGSTPFALAILICDSVITDENSKKKTLVGVFDRIYVGKFPTTHHPLDIYARLSDAEGNYRFRLDYVQVKTDKILARAEAQEISIADRLMPFEMVFKAPLIPIPAEGQYEFRIWANDRYVGRVSFEAVLAQPKGVR